MTERDPRKPSAADQAAEGSAGRADAEASASAAGRLRVGGALGRTVEAGLSGEAVSASGVLAAIGGWRGVVEALLPGVLFLAIFIWTRDPRLSAIAPAVLAVVAIAIRLIRREPLTAAFSGAIGVAICVGVTLFSGKGQDFFLPGFWVNGAWAIGLAISLLVGWPLLGFAAGALSGDLTGWRKDRAMRRAATLCTLLWLGMFVLRLGVQLPLYATAQVEALGAARLAMGIPLFALVVLFSWLVLSRVSGAARSSDESAVSDTPNASAQ